MNKMSYGYHHIYAFVKKINEKNTEDLQFAETESVLTQSWIYISPRKNTFSASDDF